MVAAEARFGGGVNKHQNGFVCPHRYVQFSAAGCVLSATRASLVNAGKDCGSWS